jgi:hypothetical protein
LPVGLGRPAAGRGLRPLLTQLATPILTPKIGLIKRNQDQGRKYPNAAGLAVKNRPHRRPRQV